MGNSPASQLDSEIRILIHEFSSHINYKSSLLYQISQLKLKLSSKMTFSDGTDEEIKVDEELKEIPNNIEILKELKAQLEHKKSKKIQIETPDHSSIIENKQEELNRLKFNEAQIFNEIQQIVEAKNRVEETIEEIRQKEKELEDEMVTIDYKKRYYELVEENKVITDQLDEANSKAVFLNKKRNEHLAERGLRRKKTIGMTIVNPIATQLRSKYILKQEFIKTIQEITSEQADRYENIDKNKADLDSKIKEEEYVKEISSCKDQILQIEWRIQELTKEKEKLMSLGCSPPEFSINIGSDEKIGSELEENSFGNSIASMMNSLDGESINNDNLGEDIQKLRHHVAEFFSIKSSKSPS